MDTGKRPEGAALIALDWGTSSLRGYLMDRDGRVLAERSAAHGILHLPAPGAEGFERALDALCGDWLAVSPLPVVAGGMVGSAQGWAEAPYVRCPADTGTLAAHAVAVTTAAGLRVLIAPGVLYEPADAPPDVMRGEEIQIAGALAGHPDWARASCMVLPGTHSKWVRVAEGRIRGFATHMTGELFALLCRHSILGRLMPDAPAADAAAAGAAFDAGLDAARAAGPGDLTHQIFAARTLGLTHRMPPDLLKDYLSGLLIGNELVSGLSHGGEALAPGTPLLLVGEPSLCRRYAKALERLGVRPAALLENPAPGGLHRFAAAAGLIATPHTEHAHA